jgi:hypothetical protein
MMVAGGGVPAPTRMGLITNPLPGQVPIVSKPFW